MSGTRAGHIFRDNLDLKKRANIVLGTSKNRLKLLLFSHVLQLYSFFHITAESC
jgi:hypothetical protein